MITRKECLLTSLIEECCETGQRATKALRFGIEEIQPGQKLTNKERLIYEFNDIFAAMELLQENGCIDRIIDRSYIEEKKIKIEKFIKYSIECGTVAQSE